MPLTFKCREETSGEATRRGGVIPPYDYNSGSRRPVSGPAHPLPIGQEFRGNGSKRRLMGSVHGWFSAITVLW